MTEPTISCPSCKTEIKLTESLAAPLIASTRLQFEKQLAQKDSDIAQREQAMRDKEKALAEDKRKLDDQVADQVANQLKTERARVAAEEAKKAKAAAANELEGKVRELADLQGVLKEREVKLAEAQRAQAELIKKQRELDPDYQLMLLEAFEQLVEQGRCQVLMTTHTPTLARRADQNCLRLISKQNGAPLVESGSVPATLRKIVDTLGVLPDHDVKAFFCVEGKHDISFLKHISAVLAPAEPDIPDLAAEEAAGRLVFVPLGGSSLELWVTRLQGLNRPEFYLTDRDNAPPLQPKYHVQMTAWTARGCTAWVTGRRELENYLHPSLLTGTAPGYAGTGADFDDVPALFAEALHAAAPGVQPWATLAPEKKKDKSSAAKKRLNAEVARQMTPALLTQSDPTNEIRQWLRAVGLSLAV